MSSEITLRQWYKKYDKTAKMQGWSLFTRDDLCIVEICRLDEVDSEADTEEEAEKLRKERKQLKDDGEALDVVIKQAVQGCVMSLLALYLDGKHIEYPDCDSTSFFCPRLLRKGNWVKPDPRIRTTITKVHETGATRKKKGK